MRQEDRERAVAEVVTRVVDRAVAGGHRELETALADTIYHERQRVEKLRDPKQRGQALAHWDAQRSKLLAGSDHTRREQLRAIVEDFTREVLGNFEPRVHAFATRAVPFGLSALLHALSPRQLLKRFPDLGLDDRIVVDGDVEIARKLRDRGTLVVVPSHSSNLDSIVLGYAMHEQGFPPLLYGAGLNLFENPLLAFFMRNLGAYTVDRRKTAPVYRDVLKEYATVSLEFGYHNLFFPGGTRARSGAIEQKLKLGLLGTALGAYGNNVRMGRPRPKIFIVPQVLSYELVLEAETLIDDFLREMGKSRYIITDDEFASPKRILDFFAGILELDARIHMTFMPPIDPFGNPVDEEGNSLDGQGRVIDTEQYLHAAGGEQVVDANRDHEYTRALGRKLVEVFHQGNTVFPTHVVAWAVFHGLRARVPGQDLYRFLRGGGETDSLTFGEAARRVEALRDRLDALARVGRIRLDERVRLMEPADLILHALRALGTYHSRPALERRGDRVFSRDRNLLYYYRNRLDGYGLETA